MTGNAAALNALATIVLIVFSVAARGEPQQQVGVDITELPQAVRGKWCVDTEYPEGGTLYKRCDKAERPAVSIGAKLVVAQTGAKCAFNNGMIAGPQPLYLIEVACPVGNLIYWMVRDDERAGAPVRFAARGPQPTTPRSHRRAAW
jgi:hypothetical protein